MARTGEWCTARLRGARRGEQLTLGGWRRIFLMGSTLSGSEGSRWVV